jgi:hypothetical protein
MAALVVVVRCGLRTLCLATELRSVSARELGRLLSAVVECSGALVVLQLAL